MIGIIIIDSNEAYRNELCTILSNQKDFSVLGAGSDSYAAIKLVKDLMPDIVLMDSNLPQGDGIKTATLIKYKSPCTSVIVNWDGEDRRIFSGFFESISGYINKGTNSDLLCHSIRAVYYGGSLVSPEIATNFKTIAACLADSILETRGELRSGELRRQAERREPKDRSANPIAVLPRSISSSEIKIMGFVGLGYTNKEIAKKLCITEGTVRNYISSVLHKTGFRDRTQVALYALKSGL